MAKHIVFVHGMFQNPVSWQNWVSYFEAKGYECHAPAWPLHSGTPADLRNNPPAGLGDLELKTIVAEIESVVSSLPEPPIIIGHSVGGLITQLLVAKGLAKAGVPIDSVAPNAMLAFDWGFMKNSALIANPFKGNEPFLMDFESFHGSFCNTLEDAAAKDAYERTATHDSRNVLRDCLGPDGQIDVELPHVPLLFIGGVEDEIIPYELSERNAEAYNDPVSISDFKSFPNRDHFICNDPGWEEVAGYIAEWLEQNVEQ